MLFITNVLNPVIHPITHLFLMGSSKGKDIIFFAMMGFFLIFSQLFTRYEFNSKKYLKISIVLGSITLIAGILLEVIFRYQMVIGLNTIFMSIGKSISSTSILHTHLLKSIFGEVITNIMGPFIESEINTGVGLYAYIPEVAKLVIILLPILFITLLLSVRNKRFVQTFLLSFFASCLLIGALDGGMFSTPAITGICGIFLIYRNGECIEQLVDHIISGRKICENCKIMPPFKNKKDLIIVLIKRYAPYIAAALIILLRFSIAIIGANTDYYEVDVVNPVEDIELNDFPIENITHEQNKTVYIMNSDYNEMELLNDLKIPLNNSCEYYTLSWNIFSYLEPNHPLTNTYQELKN
ncbi:hypothetical protein [Methanobrevibacter sp.]|uniref:hypothetical protein n=1 Tax=Methanobrevibacter sp. TaxID=66852 RepID=UPI0025FFB3A1|nr:hypothetical protein [Methanobrevibacter sp.]